MPVVKGVAMIIYDVGEQVLAFLSVCVCACVSEHAPKEITQATPARIAPT